MKRNSRGSLGTLFGSILETMRASHAQLPVNIAQRITMTFKISLKTRTSARAFKLSAAAGAALLTVSCASGPVTGQFPVTPGPGTPGPDAGATALTDQQWQSIAQSEMQVVAGSQPLISPSGTLSANKQRKLALRQLAERSIRTDAPSEYSVVKGDTLWDISGRFLSRPWLWPEIWHVNPQIENPHLIYPGDRIALTYVEGSPRLQLIRANSKPARQSTPVGTIPSALIEQFLGKPMVVSDRDIADAAYVAATQEGRLIGSTGDHVYARGNISGSRYSIFRPGKILIDPDSNQVLGREAIHVSNASVVKAGDPTKLVITSSERETLKGDRLMASDTSAPAYYQPRAAATNKPGKIISLNGAVARVGQNQVVVLNLGDTDGIQAGDTFNISSNDRIVRDDVKEDSDEFFTIEGEQTGVAMVFRTFDRVSYALIMSSTRAVKLYDTVTSTASQL